ncbi:MAG TPA: HXXEE domain-containing protein [Terriglobales bacterium]
MPRRLLWATVLPLLVIAAAFVIGSHALLLAALFIETVLLVNAVGHSLTALLLGSYVPGLITAIVINLPVGIYVLERALREQWIRPIAAWQLIGVAIALHLIWHSSVYWRAGWRIHACLIPLVPVGRVNVTRVVPSVVAHVFQ